MRRRPAWPRKATDMIVKAVSATAAGIGLAALAWILVVVLGHGAAALNWEFFTGMPSPPGGTGGGLANAIVGTLLMTLLACVMGVPIGMLTGVYLAEFGRGNRFATSVRFLVNVMMGIPSIIIGLFVYTMLVVPAGHFSGWAGGVALALLIAARGRAHHGGHARARAESAARVGAGARRAALALHASDRLSRREDRIAHRNPAGRGPGERRDRASAVHRAQQPLYAEVALGADRKPDGHDLTTTRCRRTPTGNKRRGVRRSCITIGVLALTIVSRDPDTGESSDERIDLNGHLGDTARRCRVPTVMTRMATRRRCSDKDLRARAELLLRRAPGAIRQRSSRSRPAGSRRSSVRRVAASPPTSACTTASSSSTATSARRARCWLDGENILGPGIDLIELRRKVGMIFQKPTPFPLSVFENVAYGVRLHYRVSRSELDQRVEQALRAAALWDEVKDKLEPPGTALSGGQQQRLCIARAHRGRARGAADGRADLGHRPDRDARDRRPDPGAEEASSRSSSSPTTCSRRRASPTSPRSSSRAVSSSSAPARSSSPSRSRNRPEDYVTGRFG